MGESEGSDPGTSGVRLVRVASDGESSQTQSSMVGSSETVGTTLRTGTHRAISSACRSSNHASGVEGTGTTARATIETLAEIKNPPKLFAQQANVAHGPQEVYRRLAQPWTVGRLDPRVRRIEKTGRILTIGFAKERHGHASSARCKLRLVGMLHASWDESNGPRTVLAARGASDRR